VYREARTRRSSGCGFRVELGDGFVQLLLEGRLIVLWMTADEFKAIAVDGSAALIKLLVRDGLLRLRIA
jgi:hypothetical protein